MTVLRLHHRRYSFVWDLVDLWHSAFFYTPLHAPPDPAALPTEAVSTTPAELSS
jgi:hypothetical protein